MAERRCRNSVGGSPCRTMRPSGPPGDQAALRERRQGARHRRPLGGDQARDELVGQVHRDDDAVGGAVLVVLAPALGDVPEQHEQPDVDPDELPDREVEQQRARPRDRPREQRRDEIGPAADHRRRSGGRAPRRARARARPTAAPATNGSVWSGSHGCSRSPGPRSSAGGRSITRTWRTRKPLRISRPRLAGDLVAVRRAAASTRRARASTCARTCRRPRRCASSPGSPSARPGSACRIWTQSPVSAGGREHGGEPPDHHRNHADHRADSPQVTRMTFRRHDRRFGPGTSRGRCGRSVHPGWPVPESRHGGTMSPWLFSRTSSPPLRRVALLRPRGSRALARRRPRARRRRGAHHDRDRARATQIAAWAGTVVWSTFDATTNDYHLVVSRNGAAPQRLPVAPSANAFDVDLGTNRSGSTYAVYSRCTTPATENTLADRLRPLPPEHRLRRRDEARHALVPDLGRARADDLPRRDRVHPRRDARRPQRRRPAHRQHDLGRAGHDRARRAQPSRRLAPGPGALREPAGVHPVQPQRDRPRRPRPHAEGRRERQAGLPGEVRRRELRERHRLRR